MRRSAADLLREAVGNDDWSPPALLARFQVTAARRLISIIERFGGALLADDVGLGKSFVAVAVAKRYFDAGHEVEVIVPAALRDQWHEVLSIFGLNASVVSHDSIPTRRGNQPSIVIVDEAHRFRNHRTERYRRLSTHLDGARVLLVTATPLCNAVEDVQSQLRLFLEDDALAIEGVLSVNAAFEAKDLDAVRQILSQVMVRRTADALPNSLQLASVERSVIRFDPDRGGDVVRRINALTFPGIRAIGDIRLARSILMRRLESGPAAVGETVRRQRRFYRLARESLLAGRTLSRSDCREIFGVEEGRPFQALLFAELWLPAAVEGSSIVEVDAELAALDAILAAIGTLEDSKAERLQRHVSHGAVMPLIVFTSAIATARQLHEKLGLHLRTAMLTSRSAKLGAATTTPSHVLDGFARGSIDVLIATDIASEGLNLQSCGEVIHYDLPWNPVRIDQRNGRANRIGQLRDEVRATYFVPDRRMHRAVPAAVARKNRLRRAVIDCEPIRRWNRFVDEAIESNAIHPSDGVFLLIGFIACGTRCRQLFRMTSQTIEAGSGMFSSGALRRLGDEPIPHRAVAVLRTRAVMAPAGRFDPASVELLAATAESSSEPGAPL